MSQREWYIWHIVRNFGPMTNRQIWNYLWENLPSGWMVGINWSNDVMGFKPRGVGPDAFLMEAEGMLRRKNGPGRRGKPPIWEAI